MVYEELMSKRVVVFFDDGSSHDNVKRKCGVVSELSDNMIMIVEDETSTRIIFPRERIIRVEMKNDG